MYSYRINYSFKIMFKSILLATLPIPHVSVQNTRWTFTSPDGSQVVRYIVEFECSVRNITFVEKYMSVSANSGGPGRVARNSSCFGGLGQLYRVKVWSVSGHNISQQPAVRCLTPDGQCREGRRCTRTCSVPVVLCFYFDTLEMMNVSKVRIV